MFQDHGGTEKTQPELKKLYIPISPSWEGPRFSLPAVAGPVFRGCPQAGIEAQWL